MANRQHLDMLLFQDVATWNKWRQEHPDIVPDLSAINLNKADIDLFNDLRKDRDRRLQFLEKRMKAQRNKLRILNDSSSPVFSLETDLGGMDLSGANISKSNLAGMNLSEANLS